jgi:hypothetical protein
VTHCACLPAGGDATSSTSSQHAAGPLDGQGARGAGWEQQKTGLVRSVRAVMASCVSAWCVVAVTALLKPLDMPQVSPVHDFELTGVQNARLGPPWRTPYVALQVLFLWRSYHQATGVLRQWRPSSSDADGTPACSACSACSKRAPKGVRKWAARKREIGQTCAFGQPASGAHCRHTSAGSIRSARTAPQAPLRQPLAVVPAACSAFSYACSATIRALRSAALTRA